ncbi:MAG: NAD(P)H-dependent oxidoreductase [Parcubacteria group bacterium]|nr:NAD(P)H-dependent oxidoreductase [Parcubacteria group bacterium]
MKPKKIFILSGHPDAGETLSRSIVEAYARGARENFHEVRVTHIGELRFDPILHKGYKEIQTLEPDLVKTQESMKWADHIVITYPNWWVTMPALLKGLFDRIFLPGFAFRFHKDRPYSWEKLLQRKTGRIIVTMDTPRFLDRILFGDNTNELRRGILGFAGVHPVRVSKIGSVKFLSKDDTEKQIQKIYTLGRKGR